MEFQMQFCGLIRFLFPCQGKEYMKWPIDEKYEQGLGNGGMKHLRVMNYHLGWIVSITAGVNDVEMVVQNWNQL